jgi:hypothetical protein
MAQKWSVTVQSRPEECAPLVQCIFGVDVLPGFHAIILRDHPVPSHVLEKLGLPERAPPGAYVQTTPYNGTFVPFNRTGTKMYMTLQLYTDLLEFFATDYPSLRERLRHNVQSMLQLDQPISLGKYTGYYYHGVTTARVTMKGPQGEDTATLSMYLKSTHLNQTDVKCFLETVREERLILSPRLMQEFSPVALPELKVWLNLDRLHDPTPEERDIIKKALREPPLPMMSPISESEPEEQPQQPPETSPHNKKNKNLSRSLTATLSSSLSSNREAPRSHKSPRPRRLSSSSSSSSSSSLSRSRSRSRSPVPVRPSPSRTGSAAAAPAGTKRL